MEAKVSLSTCFTVRVPVSSYKEKSSYSDTKFDNTATCAGKDGAADEFASTDPGTVTYPDIKGNLMMKLKLVGPLDGHSFKE